MRTVALVPIKLDNERFPGKNTMRFTRGEPLICYILKTLHDVSEIDDIYVYCSSEEIVGFLPEYVTFQKRDSYYDLSSTPFNEVLSSFATIIEANYYVLTHATAPFISAESISKGVRAVQMGKYDSAFSVLRLQDFLWKDGAPVNYSPSDIPRTQDLVPFFKETCGMYVYGRELILSENRRIGDNPLLVEVSQIEACDINTREDFDIANALHLAALTGEL